MSGRPPAYVVDGLPSASVLPPGWTVTPLADLPAEPFDLSSIQLAVVEVVATTSTARAVLLAAARGVAVVASVRLDPDGADEADETDEADDADHFLDDLGRLTELHDPYPAAAALEPDHVALLRALAAGATLTAAAGDLGLSRRTAVRRLADARRRLGVSTTAQAVARVDNERPRRDGGGLDTLPGRE